MPQRDTNFYYSFVALDADRRDAIIAVWDFFRAVDDAVDEPQGAQGATAEAREAAARDQIRIWRRELAACFEDGTMPRTHQGRSLVLPVSRFNLPRDQFEYVIDGVAMDIVPRRWETFEDLRQYCLRVASAVGLICIEIFGYRNPACRQYAVDLGIALQLTNVIRDLGKDLRAGRVYIPQEDLRRFGVDEADLRAGRVAPRIEGLLMFQAARAREYFARAARHLPPEDAKTLVAARIMGAIYQSLLRRIEMTGFDVFGEPVSLSRAHKAGVALWTWCRTMAGL